MMKRRIVSFVQSLCKRREIDVCISSSMVFDTIGIVSAWISCKWMVVIQRGFFIGLGSLVDLSAFSKHRWLPVSVRRSLREGMREV